MPHRSAWLNLCILYGTTGAGSFLLSPRSCLSAHPDIFSRSHSAMAEICLTYLTSQLAKASSTAPSPDTQNTPFLEYRSVYWGIHAKGELSDCTRPLALELLRRDYGQISTKLLLARAKDLYFGYVDTWSPFSGLHCVSFFGIIEVVASLIEGECHSINEGDFLAVHHLHRLLITGMRKW